MVIEKSAAFLNKALSSDQTKALVDHLSFANMKSNSAVNYKTMVKMHQKLQQINVEGEFIRSGKVNQWQGEMPESIVEEFDKLTREKLVPHNFSF